MCAEDIADGPQILRRLKHKNARLTLGDLHISLKDCGIPEDNLQRRDGHSLRYRAEIEDTLLLQSSQVEQAIVSMFESIQHHLRNTVEGLLAVFLLEQVLPRINVFGPDLLGVEATVVFEVFVDISDDVGLLEKQTHRLVQVFTLKEGGVGEFGLGEETRKTLPNNTGNIMAIEVVVLNCVDSICADLGILGEVCHAVTHLSSDVLDDDLVGFLHLLELFDDDVEFLKEMPVLLIGPTLCESPPILLQYVVKAPQERFLLLNRKGHVIFDRIQPTENEVENCNRNKQLGVQFLYDGAEASAGLFELDEAFLQVGALLLRVALVNCLVPYFPSEQSR